MIKADETSPSGYLLTGKIYQAMKNDSEAANIYATELRRASEVQKSRAQSSYGVRDLLRRLPPELVLLIFGYIPFRQVVQLQRVCTSWKGLIESSPCLWRSLDFRTCKKESVSPEILKSCISKCKGSVSKVYLSNLTPLCSALCLAIVLDHNVPLDIVERISLDIQSNSWEPNIPLSTTNDEAPRQLTYLYLDQSIGFVFNNWMTLGDVTWSRMSQLTVFRAHAKIFPDIVDVLCRGFLPKLKILDCYYDPKESGRCRSIYNVSIPRPGSPNYQTLSELEVFNIGGIPAESAGKHGSGNGKGVSVYIDHRELDNFLWMLPNLKKFSCIDVHASSRGPDGHYFERTDFRHNPALEELVIIGTWLERMPILSASCKKLIMCKTSMTPRTVIHGGSEMRYDSCYLGEDDTVLLDEYSSIEVLDLSRCEMLIDSKLVATLARCDGSRLTSLNLANCPGLFFSTPTDGAVLMARIVQCCPSLRKLNVSENSSVGDFVLLEISKLRYLEYLDISCTGVHDLGVLLLLKGLFLGLAVHMDYLCEDSALREMIQNNRAVLLGDDPAAYPMVFNTLIANGCQGISDDMCWWIEDIGICIDCKLFTEANIKKRKREEI
ncbi:hypothetical protein V1520DRAFT_367533 [Lipomyces starkeyi]|uniref:F-box domain-containing protein n=1 Tax=Lipomyces starkeyi NRRL Y-11557 TaxID=675824 RepID=A0A1E3Q4A0_LIPST|nr:hypothetical protein LIPSTDRAFT_105152 [Lipomyces starkeyi NRRL Y-11557]